MKTNRRGFLKRTAAGLAALWAVGPTKILKEPEAEESEPDSKEDETEEIKTEPSHTTHFASEPIWTLTANGYVEVGRVHDKRAGIK